MQEVLIVSAVRTPIGRFGGSLHELSPAELGAQAMRGALERAGAKGEDLNLYVFGNVLRAGHGQLIPRQAAIRAGIPESVDGFAVDMVCSSGMMSLTTAAALIRSGDAEVVLAGGTESMSQAGFYLSARARWGYKLLTGEAEALADVMLRDGLTDPMRDEAMGVQTERLIAEHGISRRELDEVAAESHRRAAAATESGAFRSEIVPVTYRTRKGKATLENDEGIRADSTVETLAGLRPAFSADGTLTAGNSSQISDGASALLLASRRAVDEHGWKPIARIVGSAWAAGPTWRFPEAPVPAVRSVLDRIGSEIGDFDLFENNEAFAVNSLLFCRMLGVDPERLNVLGGAIALGHPIGASGARIVTTLVHALHRRDVGRGLAAICHGTGGGTAIAVDRV
ncbi:MAG TPA: thiolase family protein [Rhodothermales bacterium]